MADLTKTTINYVSPEKLSYYDSKVKARMLDAVEAARLALQNNIDAANTAIEAEATRAKAAEATNALAAQAAQTDVDNLEAYVGTFTSDTATTVVEYIDAKTSNIASDETVNALAGRVGQNEEDIEALEKAVGDNKTAIEGTVAELAGTVAENESDIEEKMTNLTERVAANETAVSTTLPNAIKAEEERALEVEGGLAERIETMEAFWDAAKADGDEGNVIDTLKEIQEYIASDETGASDMLAAINQNKDDIDALEGLVGSKAVATQIQEAITAANLDQYATDEDVAGVIARIVALEAVDHEHANKALLDTYDQTNADLADAVAKKHEHANKAELDLIQSGDKAKWDAAESNAKAHADSLNEAMDGRMDAVEAAIAEGGDTAKAIEEAKKAGTDAQEAVDALAEGAVATNTSNIATLTQTHATDKANLEAADTAMAERLQALESVEHVEITEEEINQIFAEEA